MCTRTNRKIYKAGVGMDYKRKLWEMTVLPTVTYDCEALIMSTKVRNKLRVTVRAMERYLLEKTRRDRVTNLNIRKMFGFKNIVKIIMKRVGREHSQD